MLQFPPRDLRPPAHNLERCLPRHVRHVRRGVVGKGETYLDAARREIREELGIIGPEPRSLFLHLYEGPLNRSWVAVYEVEWDGPIVHQVAEVEWGAFLTRDSLMAKLGEWEFVPDGLEIFQRFLQAERQSRVGS